MVVVKVTVDAGGGERIEKMMVGGWLMKVWKAEIVVVGLGSFHHLDPSPTSSA